MKARLGLPGSLNCPLRCLIKDGKSENSIISWIAKKIPPTETPIVEPASDSVAVIGSYIFMVSVSVVRAKYRDN